MMYLEIRHNPELVDLFPVELLQELIRCVRYVLRRGDRTANNKNIGTGLQGVFHNVDPDAAGSCDKELAARCFLECRDVAPGMGGLLDIDRTVEFHDVGFDF